VTINGSTSTTVNGTTTNATGGLLAQRTNIGSYERNQFTMVPELGATLGYQVTQRLRATMGYSLVYMGNVVRPGDQVDLNVNPNLLPPENVPFTGPLRPQFHFVETDYLIHGLNFGGEFRW
ncbi:MAG: BBP7 family outer membrane beta-barrel protein, partial [Aureliella sp.]